MLLETVTSWTFFGIAVVEQILSYSPEGYPKSISQLIITGAYKLYELSKRAFKRNDDVLKDVVMVGIPAKKINEGRY
jgi:hypothetical protein